MRRRRPCTSSSLHRHDAATLPSLERAGLDLPGHLSTIELQPCWPSFARCWPSSDCLSLSLWMRLLLDYGEKINRKSIDYRLHGSSSMKIFRAFNALGAIAFSFGDAMLPEIQSTVKEPAKKNMYKGVSAAYGVIVLTYWQLAFTGYWAFGSQVQPYIVSSLTIPEWTIVMANIFAVIQISGCYQIYCRPTYACLEEKMLPKGENNNMFLRNFIRRLALTSIYIVLITLIAAAMPFFGDFVSICGAVGFTPLDFVFPALAFLKSGRLPKRPSLRLLVQIFNFAIAIWFSIVAILGCIGAIRFIVLDIKTYKFFHDI